MVYTDIFQTSPLAVGMSRDRNLVPCFWIFPLANERTGESSCPPLEQEELQFQNTEWLRRGTGQMMASSGHMLRSD